MFKCPDCGISIRGDSCGACGWRRPIVIPPQDGGAELANEARRLSIERANASAARFCAERGLDTLEKMREFIRSRGVGKLVIREPGQDEEAA